MTQEEVDEMFRGPLIKVPEAEFVRTARGFKVMDRSYYTTAGALRFEKMADDEQGAGG